MDIGTRIKQRREWLRLSQGQLSQLSGVSQASIHYIEAGENSPTAKTLLKLAAALGVGLTELLGGEAAAGDIAGNTKRSREGRE